jgi:non-ribosomal peptide synthetase component F
VDTSSSGMEADIEYLTKEASKFDLHLMLRERSDGGLHGDLIYSCDLFEDQTMDKFSEHFINVVKAVSTAAMGKVSIHALPMLDQEETHMLQDVWNQMDRSTPEECLSEPLLESPKWAHDIGAVRRLFVCKPVRSRG